MPDTDIIENDETQKRVVLDMPLSSGRAIIEYTGVEASPYTIRFVDHKRQSISDPVFMRDITNEFIQTVDAMREIDSNSLSPSLQSSLFSYCSKLQSFDQGKSFFSSKADDAASLNIPVGGALYKFLGLALENVKPQIEANFNVRALLNVYEQQKTFHTNLAEAREAGAGYERILRPGQEPEEFPPPITPRLSREFMVISPETSLETCQKLAETLEAAQRTNAELQRDLVAERRRNVELRREIYELHTDDKDLDANFDALLKSKRKSIDAEESAAYRDILQRSAEAGIITARGVVHIDPKTNRPLWILPPEQAGGRMRVYDLLAESQKDMGVSRLPFSAETQARLRSFYETHAGDDAGHGVILSMEQHDTWSGNPFLKINVRKNGPETALQYTLIDGSVQKNEDNAAKIAKAGARNSVELESFVRTFGEIEPAPDSADTALAQRFQRNANALEEQEPILDAGPGVSINFTLREFDSLPVKNLPLEKTDQSRNFRYSQNPPVRKDPAEVKLKNQPEVSKDFIESSTKITEHIVSQPLEPLPKKQILDPALSATAKKPEILP